MEKKILTALSTVIDPELQIPITDMGLIYNVSLSKDGTAKITMTLTTIGCPLFDVIHDAIKKAVTEIDGINDIDIDLTFDPPWTPEMMTDAAKAEFGFL